MNFKRLNDCCDALRANPNPDNFTMNMYYFMALLDSPRCVLGHYECHILKRLLFSNGPLPMAHAAKHFGVSEPEAYALFDSYGCDNAKTTQEAIAYIEGFIRRHGGEVRGAYVPHKGALRPSLSTSKRKPT